MTFSIPYSFVPGTKAKANEVNANFIAVLDEIEQMNTDLDTLNQSKINLDLSNLNTTGQEILDSKANNVDIDGSWTKKEIRLVSDVPLNGTSNISYSLEDYLPSDDNIYEVMIDCLIDSSTTSGQLSNCTILSSVQGSTCVARCRPRTAAQIGTGGSAIILIGTDRLLTLQRASNWYGTVNINLNNYRKVR